MAMQYSPTVDLPNELTSVSTQPAVVEFTPDMQEKELRRLREAKQVQMQDDSIDPTSMQQLVEELQAASSQGATQLPSRDMPMQTTMLTHDPSIVPNYIPTSHVSDYIPDDADGQPTRTSYSEYASLYEEYQLPVFLCILFFVFLTPKVKQLLLGNVPLFDTGDGNVNFYGMLFLSVVFGVCVRLVTYCIVS